MKNYNLLSFAILIIAIVFSLSVNNSLSQVNTNAKNIVYLDVGIIFTGSTGALGVGLNYERMLNDNVSIRTGVNIGIFGAGTGGDAFAGSGIGFPVSVNYMTNNKNKFEIGAGAGPYLGFDNRKLKLLPAVRLGYRYQTDENGLMYRAGVEFPSNMYISLGGIGYQFK
jgi:hypothetical protein